MVLHYTERCFYILSTFCFLKKKGEQNIRNVNATQNNPTASLKQFQQ